MRNRVRLFAGVASVVLAISAGVLVAQPASASPVNMCLASGKLVQASSNLDYALFRYTGYGDHCDVMSVQVQAYRDDGPSGAYYYTFRQVLAPVEWISYQTPKNTNSYYFRGCSWNGVSPSLHCEQTDTSWEFSRWHNWTSFNVWYA